MAGSSNAINLTDGVDGLAIGCTISVALTFMVLSYCAGNHIISDYLLISYIPGVGENYTIKKSNSLQPKQRKPRQAHPHREYS